MFFSGERRREIWRRVQAYRTGDQSAGVCREEADHLGQRRPVQGPRRGSKRTDPVEGQLGLEDNGADALSGALANGGGGVVDSRATVDGEWG